MSIPKELEELQNKKTALQEESRSLNDKQQNLDERVRILEEKIAVEELKNSNRTTREAISQLESKIGALEQRLGEVSHESDVHESEKPQNAVADTWQTEETAPVVTETTLEDSEDEAVTVAAPEEPAIVEQENFNESKRAHEKKKRKLF